MLISLVYVVLRRVLHLVMLFGRSRDFKELEIVVSGTSWASCGGEPVAQQ